MAITSTSNESEALFEADNELSVSIRAKAPIKDRVRDAFGRAVRDETGAETAEYALVIMAAVALAGVLVAVVQSDGVRQIIEDLVVSAFNH